jgi:hypothetical protein
MTSFFSLWQTLYFEEQNMKNSWISSSSPIPPPIPIKMSYWEHPCFFSCSNNSPIPLHFFCGHQYFSHLPSKKKGDTTPPIPWGPSQLPLFNYIFSYAPIEPTFHMVIVGDILGYCCNNSPNKSRKWYWATPIPSYWGTAGVALRDKKKHRKWKLGHWLFQTSYPCWKLMLLAFLYAVLEEL